MATTGSSYQNSGPAAGTNGHDSLTDGTSLHMESINMSHSEGEHPKKPRGIGQRHLFLVLSFVGLAVAYMLRVVLSVAIVAMVIPPSAPNVTNVTVSTNTFASTTPTAQECPAGEESNATSTGEFHWNSAQQGLILGSFYWGYIITGIPGGILSGWLGGKYFYGCGILGTAVFTILTPVVTRWLDIYGIIICRALEGLLEGVTLPAMHNLLHNWAPPEERSWFTAGVFSGAMIGTIITYPVGGLLCVYGFDNGWGSAFYIFGAIGVVWFIVWIVLTRDSPLEHPWISDNEKNYLKVVCHLTKVQHHFPKIPLKSVFTSLPFYSTIVGHFTFTWGYYSMLSLLPTYMGDVLHFNLHSSALLLALPYIAHTIVLYVTSPLADLVRAKKLLGEHTTTWVRKIANGVGFIVPAIALCLLLAAGCNTVGVIILLVVAVGFQAFAISGFYVNHLDLAPPYAGLLMGITNAVATIPGIVTPYLAGLIVASNPSSTMLWMIFFWISAAIYVVGTVFFCIFGSGDLQPWAKEGMEPEHEPEHDYDPHNEHLPLHLGKPVVELSPGAAGPGTLPGEAMFPRKVPSKSSFSKLSTPQKSEHDLTQSVDLTPGPQSPSRKSPRSQLGSIPESGGLNVRGGSKISFKEPVANSSN